MAPDTASIVFPRTAQKRTKLSLLSETILINHMEIVGNEATASFNHVHIECAIVSFFRSMVVFLSLINDSCKMCGQKSRRLE